MDRRIKRASNQSPDSLLIDSLIGVCNVDNDCDCTNPGDADLSAPSGDGDGDNDLLLFRATESSQLFGVLITIGGDPSLQRLTCRGEVPETTGAGLLLGLFV